jgi:hypothetical protein
MTTDFRTVVSAPPSGRSTALVIDHLEYAQALILRGKPIPWGDPAQYVNFLGQAQGLLRPDTTLVDLGALYTSLIAPRPDLVSAMSARNRVGYALKTLLSDETAAGQALELATVVAQTSRRPLVLQIPSPLRWLAETHVHIGGSLSDLEPDHGENVSVYVADWLRRLSTLPVSLLLLDGRRADVPGLAPDDLDAYTPITNAAEHYRWAVALRTDECVEVPGAHLKGDVVPREYWLEGDVVAVPAADFLVAEIPGHAAPETVLSRLAELG